MARPAAELPTCATTSTSPATSAAPTAPSPPTTSNTPSGRCAASNSAKRRPVCGHRSLGLCTTAVPPPQLGVLHQGADPGLDPTPRVLPALAGLPFVQRRELVGGVTDSACG